MNDLNEPAFPIIGAAADHQFTGLTLRDYFAAKAMHAIITEPASNSLSVCQYLSDAEPGDADSKGARMARAAYAMADAMLKARQG